MALAIYLGGRERRGGTRRARDLTRHRAANQRRFFDDFSDAFLERLWVDLGIPFGALLGLKRIQNDVENR